MLKRLTPLICPKDRTHQLLSSRPRHYLSHDAIATWIDAIAADLLTQNFTAVVGLERGGVFPALCVAFTTGLPLHYVKYDRPSQTARWVGEPPAPGKILLCEDVAGSGFTLANTLQMLQQTHAVATLTLVCDEFSRIQPDWCRRFEGVQVVFPWERHDQAPRHQRDWQQGGATGVIPMAPDHAYRRFGVDLDGVLCEDLSPEDYHTDLTLTLTRRDHLEPLSSAPSLTQTRHIIITGRPREDQQRTEDWLSRAGFDQIPLVLRDSTTHQVEQTPLHKGLAATEHGCSDFIESCPRQAIEIAALFPHLRVHWWNNGQPIIVSAQSVQAGL
jgi:hypoxanthine phosphoribosyltransferase